jgi:hypothetical protein
MGGKEQKYIKEAFDTNLAPLGPNDFERILKNIGENSLPEPCQGAIHLGLILPRRRSTLSKHDLLLQPILYLGFCIY